MKKLLLIITVLATMAFTVTDWPIHTLIPYSGNPAGILFPGDISVNGGWSSRSLNGSLFLNRGYHTGTQPASTISDFNAAANTALSSALSNKQNALNGSSLLGTINGQTFNYGSSITVAGGSGLDTNNTAYRRWIAGTARDSAQNNVFPASSKTFEIVDGKLYLRGERYTPSVQAGSTISANASGSLRTGSTDRAGVAQLVVNSTINPADGTVLLLISFGGTIYPNPPSVTAAVGQTLPGIKIVSVTTNGFTMASTGSFSLPAGTYQFPYHVEAL